MPTPSQDQPSAQGPAWTPSLSHLQDLAATVSATGKLPSQLAADVEKLRAALHKALLDLITAHMVYWEERGVSDPEERLKRAEREDGVISARAALAQTGAAKP